MRIAIFKTGTHTSGNGVTATYGVDDLQEIVTNYLAAKNEAPLVRGHPKDNSPAYGWVKKLEVVGDTLFAHIGEMTNQVQQWLSDKVYKYVSVGLSKTEQGLGLVHIGLTPLPAVEGLPEIEFSNTDYLIFNSEIDMAEKTKTNSPPVVNEPKKEEQSTKQEQSGQEQSDSQTYASLPTEIFKQKVELDQRQQEIELQFSELKALKSEVAAQAAATKARLKELQETEKRNRTFSAKLKGDRIHAAISKSVEEGRILNDFAPFLEEIAQHLPDENSITFSSFSGEQLTPFEGFLKYLESTPVIVPKDLELPEQEKEPLQYSARIPKGYSIDSESEKLYAEAREFCRKRGQEPTTSNIIQAIELLGEAV